MDVGAGIVMIGPEPTIGPPQEPTDQLSLAAEPPEEVNVIEGTVPEQKLLVLTDAEVGAWGAGQGDRRRRCGGDGAGGVGIDGEGEHEGAVDDHRWGRVCDGVQDGSVVVEAVTAGGPLDVVVVCCRARSTARRRCRWCMGRWRRRWVGGRR